MTPDIALIGGMGVGKTTILTELITGYDYTRLSWADPVKDLARLAYGHIEKNALYQVQGADGIPAARLGRELLQRIGTDALRNQVDEDFWVKCGLRRMDEANAAAAQMGNQFHWVNDDTRFPNEVAALRHRGFRIVRLIAPLDVRAERLGITRGNLEYLSQHPSERLIDSLDADLVIENTGDPVWVARQVLHSLDLQAERPIAI